MEWLEAYSNEYQQNCKSKASISRKDPISFDYEHLAQEAKG
jgi:hypothetical protein